MVTLARFCFRTQPKNLNFQKCFTSKRHFVEYFQWNAWPTSRKLIKNISHFLFTLLCFCFRKPPKNLSFQSFLPLIDPLLATFSETCAPTSRKYVAEKGFNDAKSMGDTSVFLVALLFFFILERYAENLNF